MPNETIATNDEDIMDNDDQSTDDNVVVPEVAPGTTVEASENDEEFGRLTPREKALVEKARSQEKTKVYGRINTLQQELSALKRAPLPPSTGTGNGNGGGTTRQQRDAEIQSMQQTLNQLNESLRLRDERDRQRELREYRRDKLASLRASGTAFIDSMVTGDSEEMIDASVAASIAEAAFQEEAFKQKYGVNAVPPAGGRRTTPSTVVIQQQAPRQPVGVPSTVSAGVSGDNSDVLSTAELTELTSDKAIRDGRYAANRDRIQLALRTGKVQRQ